MEHNLGLTCDQLVTMVEKMRRKIIELGGEIRFETRVEEINIEDNQVTGVTLSTGEVIPSKHVALAIGHSARDTFKMLHDKGVHLEAQSFSVGFRIEHKQETIDAARFGKNAGHPLLGAADYKLIAAGWALQRADHGEMIHWAIINFAAIAGKIDH